MTRENVTRETRARHSHYTGLLPACQIALATWMCYNVVIKIHLALSRSSGRATGSALRGGLRVATAVGKAGKASIRGEARSILSGVVLNQKGTAQAGVPVTLFRGNALMGEAVTSALGEFRFEKLPLGAYMLVVPEITVAGIALDGLVSRTIKLTQGAAGGRRYAPTKPRLLPEDETGGRRVLCGVVSDASGAGINGIKVRMSWSGAEPGIEFPVEATGRKADKPAGFYEFVTTPGIFSLTVVQGDWPSDAADALDTAHVLGREGQPISYEVNFQLRTAARPARVEGAVPGAQPGRSVKLTGSGVGSAGRAATLDADGRFVFGDLTLGSYRLELEGVGVVADNIVLDAGRLYKLVFPLQSQVSGHVDGARGRDRRAPRAAGLEVDAPGAARRDGPLCLQWAASGALSAPDSGRRCPGT